MRKPIALLLIFISLLWWVIPSDIVKLIVLQRPVLFGRYSQGHFASLLLLTPIIWLIGGVLFSQISLDKKLFINALLLITSSIFSIFFVIWLSQLIVSPRYVEEKLSIVGGASQHWQGIVRHRPPNKNYVYTQVDRPEQVRSYPDPPIGYPDVSINLTSDSNGYRNTSTLDQYDLIVLGDSFAAGSRVSDEQAWPDLLSKLTGMSLYNLGTSGTNIFNYVSSLIAKGLQLNPKIVVLMIYEGNDFKGLPRQAEIGDVSFTEKLKGSPLSASLKSLSRNLFESYNTTKDVPAYGKNLSWMPVKIEDVSDEGAKYYSFKPRRMLSLNVQQSIFEKSKIWQENVTLLDKFISLSKEHDFIPVIAYAPSKPHVVMPFFDVKAEDLRSYLSYKDKDLPDADMVKSSFYKNLDAQESTVEEYCRDRGISFISTTNKLQYMTEAGTQMYYTYDQHWTPMGNEVVAEIIYQHLSKMNVLSTTYSLTPKP